MLGNLLEKAKEIDDKIILIEGHLLESKIHCNSGNWTKAKSSLTASKTVAASVYITPFL